MLYIHILNILVRFDIKFRFKHGSRTGCVVCDVKALGRNRPSVRASLTTPIAGLPGPRPLKSALALVLSSLFNRTNWPQQAVHSIDLENLHFGHPSCSHKVHLIRYLSEHPARLSVVFSRRRFLPRKERRGGDKTSSLFQLLEPALALSGRSTALLG